MEHVHGVDIFDIYDISYEPWWAKTWFVITSLGFLVMVVLFFLIYFFKYRKKTLSFDYKILRELDQLYLLANNVENAHNFYCSLTNILKKYLEYSFSISTGNTDEQLLSLLSKNTNIPSSVSNEAIKILKGIDVIKFGKGTAISDQMYKSLESMKAIISKKNDNVSS